MWWLVGRLITRATQLATSRGALVAGTGVVVSDLINLDWLRAESIKLAPGSDQAAIEQASRTAASLLGLSGDEVLWPSHTRGARAGEPIIPRYLTIDLNRGRAWYSSRHVSARSLRRARGFGRRRGWSSGRRDFAQTVQTAR